MQTDLSSRMYMYTHRCAKALYDQCMCVYMYVCEYEQICTHTCIRIHKQRAHVRACACMCVFPVCVRVSACVCACVFMYVCRVFIYIY